MWEERKLSFYTILTQTTSDKFSQCFWRNVYSSTLLVLTDFSFFFVVDSEEFIILKTRPLSNKRLANKYFPQFCGLSFPFLESVL